MADSKIKISNSLQENVLTLLCYDDTHGKVISNIISPDIFEGDYRLIAEHAFKFWRRYKSAPKDHAPDFMDEILKGNTNSRRQSLFVQIFQSMNRLRENINTQFVMSQLKNLVRVQRLKAGIIESAERINKSEEQAIEEIETIWTDLLRAQEITFDSGMRMAEVDRLLDYLERRPIEFVMGIKTLDTRGVVPARGTLTNLQGVLGEGKTWFLIHVGKWNLRQQKKIVHFSLEMSEEDVIQRYLQSMWSIPTRKVSEVIATGLKIENGRLKDFTTRKIKPDFSFDSPAIKEELETRMAIIGAMSTNLVVKRFPPRRVSDREINGYLDMLEATEGFVPDLALFDAPYLYKIDLKNPRLSIESHVIDTRATCIERNMAGVMVHWINREGARAATRDLTHTSEAWGINATCDQAMSLSRTKAEEEFGLARLNINKARTTKDKWEVLITQAYELGQFCLDSMPMDEHTRGKWQELIKDTDDEDDAGNDEDED